MCPSFRVTRDEQHLTRGRANTLRLALTGQLGAEAMQSDALAEAMKLCVSCKACRRECPTGVDMAKMKIEVLAARADRHGVGRRETLVAELPRYAPIAVEVCPGWRTRANGFGPLRRLMERSIWASRRTSRMPAWSRAPFRDAEAPDADGPRGAVMLLADTFNRYFEPENLRAAAACAARRRLWRRAALGRRPAVVLRADLSRRRNGGQGARRRRGARCGRWPATCRCSGWSRPAC